MVSEKIIRQGAMNVRSSTRRDRRIHPSTRLDTLSLYLSLLMEMLSR
jgi:hypothetical protein